MEVLQNNLKRQYMLHAKEYEEKALAILRSGWYVLGQEVALFEAEWAEYIGSPYCVGLASGLDALWISFKLLGIGLGDEVIVASNAYIACVMGITINGGIPVFVEPDRYYNIDADKIEEKITDRTKAILAVHLYGQACDMTKIMEVAQKHDLKVVEDCAQSHGALWNGQKVGTFGEIGCFSFYPTKGCGAFGEAGCVTVKSKEMAEQFRVFRNYGSEKRYHNLVVGTNSRLDEIQAGFLRVKRRHMDELNSERQRLAQRYLENLNESVLELPAVHKEADHTWHQFVIRTNRRDDLADYLKKKGIGTLVHYPIPPHLSEAYRYLGKKRGAYPIAERFADTVLSLPVYNGMTCDEQDYVIEMINMYFSGDGIV